MDTGGTHMGKSTNILLRIVATFAASGLSAIGAGSVLDIPAWKSALMAGLLGIAFVVEGLSRSFLDDGKLSIKEVNDVFNKVDGKDSKDN